ncbi:hypothetical protein SAMN05421827_10589 [Pedobacter terrae]|uniref:Outer membrane protein beta-barrel domain-containing protein n=1 Tax=Pedobacter terrae TaxID=405671 RepID=A0A1G7T6Y2_9SPHI|nr:hypothetical protein [Pedobacter terrae]SDG31083.1 hypothetical protein SAMN05421827_10589 [Pedobacter terrae]
MKPILTALLFLFSLKAIAQDSTLTQPHLKKNSIYAELLGNGGVYSVNYDRIFQVSNQIKIVPRVGFSTLEDVLIFPLEVNLLLSKSNTSKNFFETGIGLTILKPLNGFSGQLLTINGYDYNFDNKAVNTPVMIRAGFRHQKPTGGLMYRTGALLITGDETLLTIGIGLGYTF